MLRFKLISALTVGALTTAAATAQIQRGVFLLDRSGSMSIGNRCQNSLDALDADLAGFFSDSLVTTEALVVEFTTDLGVYEFNVLGGGWHTALGPAMTAAATSTSCSGSTHLATAICDSVVMMRARIIAGGLQITCPSYFYVYSDGGENSSSGPCAGLNDINAAVGRCPGDSSSSDPVFEFDAGGTNLSWQRLVCNEIDSLNTVPGCFVPTIFYATTFNDFAETEAEVFHFLQSQANATGGHRRHIYDNSTVPTGNGSPFFVIPGGCPSAAGETSFLDPSDPAQLGNSFAMNLRGTAIPVKVMIVGLQRQIPAIDLAAFGGPGCTLGVQPLLTYFAPFIPAFAIPNDPAWMGQNLYWQGLAFTTTLSELVTTNVLRMTVQS